MSTPFLLLATLLALSSLGFYLGRTRAYGITGGKPYRLHSLPSYHGLYVALWCALPSLFIVAAWLCLEPWLSNLILTRHLPPDAATLDPAMRGLLIADIKNLANGDIVSQQVSPAMRAAADQYARFRTIGTMAMATTAVAAGIAGLALGHHAIDVDLRARNRVEAVLRAIMVAASLIAILTTIGIVLSLIFESMRFFGRIPLTDFLFGTRWSPQTALRADQVGSSGEFGAIPLFAGTLLITIIAMSVAVPVGLFSAIYMSEYASKRLRGVVKPTLEILAGVPTVVYGFFAALTVAPLFRKTGQVLGLDVSSESALAAGMVMGIMIIPFVSSLSDDVMNAVPQSLRDGAYALGATKSETIKQVVLPAALPGIVGAVLLAVSRAIGETMIVVMAAGMSANLTANPLEAVTTVTVQIVTLLVGDQEFDSAKTLAAFALGLVLFVLTLALNVIALTVVRRYRERYD
jgi:phosphate transport system permease protein